MTTFRLALLLLLAAVVLAACRQPSAARPTPAGSIGPTTSPAPTATTGAEGCLTLDVDTTGTPSDLPQLRKDATDVLVARFDRYGDARWTTPDQDRPTESEFRDGARLVRQLVLEVEGEIKGARSVAERAVQRGGASGCDRVTYSTEPTLEVGQRYVFFMVPLVDGTGTRTEDRLVLSAWPVGPDDQVERSRGGKMSLTELKNVIVNGPAVATDDPGNVEPSGPG